MALQEGEALYPVIKLICSNMDMHHDDTWIFFSLLSIASISTSVCAWTSSNSCYQSLDINVINFV